ncbi:MAG: hypothetical protein B7Y62_06030 [Sphingomonadales bacterium 35-56-22]|nr:MAG: hypothetical protein B7Y62_06030 [Sphingomonadales bacterium 35-56-22]OYY98013.1 MAG: hypothetical protein B7Y38_04505 [Sphingomonadales bacterium 28-56-43]OYZ60496.1 MAG: hypothetical protein B7Y10_06290 [Sphingomonadales bacterium 24-56-14]OZA82972.1 MAG: hypothetical protein B7X66_05540 [Sphingomonadales bacterium 39-57-19]
MVANATINSGPWSPVIDAMDSDEKAHGALFCPWLLVSRCPPLDNGTWISTLVSPDAPSAQIWTVRVNDDGATIWPAGINARTKNVSARIMINHDRLCKVRTRIALILRGP